MRGTFLENRIVCTYGVPKLLFSAHFYSPFLLVWYLSIHSEHRTHHELSKGIECYGRNQQTKLKQIKTWVTGRKQIVLHIEANRTKRNSSISNSPFITNVLDSQKRLKGISHLRLFRQDTDGWVYIIYLYVSGLVHDIWGEQLYVTHVSFPLPSRAWLWMRIAQIMMCEGLRVTGRRERTDETAYCTC